MVTKAWLAVASLMLSSCIHHQLTENTLQTASTVEALRVDQLLNNISDAIDVEDRIPSLVVVNTGQAQTNVSGTIGAVLPSMNFASRSRTLNVSATNAWTDYWSLSPVADPQDLQNLRALFRLLYSTDADVVQIIYDAERVNGLSVNEPRCGVTGQVEGIKPSITMPENAMTAYFDALKAFPSIPVEGHPPPNPNPAALAAPPAPRPAATETPAGRLKRKKTVAHPELEDKTKCYNRSSGVIASQAKNYGLQYPEVHEVFTDVRNGLSEKCRSYQIKNNIGASGKFPGDALFTRWLFWKDPSGEWKPENPPEDPKAPVRSMASLGYGTFGDSSRDFWITEKACLSDFIILAINATANSHAAALASPKATSAQNPP